MRSFNSKRIAKAFTLVELMVSMAIFTGMMALLMQYFSTAQKLWTASSGKAELFENARVAMDMIEGDLLCSFYSYGHSTKELYFFPTSPTQFGLAVSRAYGPFPSCTASIYEVQYKLYKNGKSCQLMVNVVGDKDQNSYNNSNYDLSYSKDVTYSSNPFTTLNEGIYDPAASNSNSDGWIEVVPNVVDFNFSIYDKKGRQIPSSAGKDFFEAPTKAAANPTTVGAGLMPYTLLYSITLVDRDCMAKYLAKHPTADFSVATDFSSFINDESVKASKRTFTRQVTIERGQFD